MSQTPTASPPSRWTSLLTPGALWMTLCIAGVLAAVVSLPIAPADFWWHLAAGERLLDGGGLLTADPYSFTAVGRPFVHQAWLAGLVFAALYRIGGLEILAVANALAFAFAYGLVAWRSVEASGHLRLAALATALGFAVSVENWTLRPQTFSVVLL
ncbi:MAG: hypothetical protein NTZ05_06275, partial [Chloroflexi bacterium]|nr:hypothetical protein [Chloroflexota bacterium]